jgi:ribosomal protein S18 acetylase RimI-like enzyme
MVRCTLLESLKASELAAFFNEWPRRPSVDAIDAMLRGSYRVVVALDGDEIVGFCNAISDGRMFAYIPFVEVHPERRHEGIGTQMMRFLLDELDHLHGVDLTCDPELVPFYEPLGLVPLVSMVRRNKDALGRVGES